MATIKKKVKQRLIKDRTALTKHVTAEIKRKFSQQLVELRTPISEDLLLHVRMEFRKKSTIKVIVNVYRAKGSSTTRDCGDHQYARTREMYKAQSFWVDANRDPSKKRGMRIVRVKKLAESRGYWKGMWVDGFDFSIRTEMSRAEFEFLFHTLR